MRFKDYSSNKVDFPGQQKDIIPEIKQEIKIEQNQIVINALPEHPYEFPQISLLLTCLMEHPQILDTFMKKYSLSGIFLLVSKKKKSDILKSGLSPVKVLKIKYTKPVYPVTKTRIASLLSLKKFDIIHWFRFYVMLSKELNQRIPGIPVSLSCPTEHTRLHILVPRNTTVKEIARAASITFDNSTICTDHPFCGTLMTPDTKLDEIKPYTFIFLPANVRQAAPLWLKIKSMVCGYCSFSFSDTFDSRPLQLDTPCQKCLYCSKICPAGLAPLMLSALYEAENIKAASKYSPELCIECGLCSYVCPSGIPLHHDIKGLKKELGVVS